MCGIAGYIDMRGESRVDKEVLDRMIRALAHRGPDSEGQFIEHDAGLGFRRLSIIDLKTGDQPLFNEDRSVVLTCNGEIYNYIELRDTLEKGGHQFRTNTDVEVLVHLFEDEGTAFLSRLNGQFAFVVYNVKDKTLFLARDQFGICPLYYTEVAGLFIYASEIKAILEHPMVAREVDLTGLDRVLTLPGAISPRTVFKNIYSVPPGHYVVVKNNDVAVREYWDLEYPRIEEADDGKPEAYYVETLKDLFERSVRYRLQADVPVG